MGLQKLIGWLQQKVLRTVLFRFSTLIGFTFFATHESVKAVTLQDLDNQADTQARAHNFASAGDLHQTALKLAQKTFGADSVEAGAEWLNLGWYFSDMAFYPKAADAFQESYRIRAKNYGEHSMPVAEVLNGQAVVAENEGDFSRAEHLYTEAIIIVRAEGGPKALANTLNNVATLYWIFGQYEKAETNLERALELRKQQYGAQSLGVATTLNNIALLEGTLGDLRAAERDFLRVLEIRRALAGSEDPVTASTESHLGMIYLQEGNMVRAEQLLDQSLEARQKFYGMQHPEVAQSLFDLGLLYDEEKRFDKAEGLLVQAMTIRQQFGEATPDYGVSLAYLGRHDHLQGKVTSAEVLYKSALAVQEKALGENHPDTLRTRRWLALAEWEGGQHEAAKQDVEQVVTGQETAVNSVFRFAPEEQRLDFEHEAGMCDLPALVGDADLIAATVLRTKGIVLDSVLEDREGPVAVSAPTTGSGNLGEVTSRAKTRRSLAVDVTDVAEKLPDDAALLEYVVYERYLGQLKTERGLGVLALTKAHDPIWVDLGALDGPGGIANAVMDYQHYVRKRVHEAILAGALHRLDQLLIEPVLAKLSGVHRLIISPDGDVNFVSFATLLDAQEHFLAEDYRIEYVASGRDLLENSEDESATGKIGKRSVVIVEAPDYDHRPLGNGKIASVEGKDRYFEPLPGCEREGEFLAAQANRAGWQVTELKGDDANEAQLAAVRSPYIFHVASHAVFVGPEMAQEWHLGSQTNGEDQVTQGMERSFLALAGANVTVRNWELGRSGIDDCIGLISAASVGRLNLHGTWLATLSACDTGTGEALCGEGVLGLRRGFAEAGAQNLLLTLWPISDSETADLMERFYTKALASGDAIGALASVQRDALVELRAKQGLTAAVRGAGAFIISR